MDCPIWEDYFDDENTMKMIVAGLLYRVINLIGFQPTIIWIFLALNPIEEIPHIIEMVKPYAKVFFPFIMGSIVIPVTVWFSDNINSMPLPKTRSERDEYLWKYALLAPIQEFIPALVIQMIMGIFVYAGLYFE